jgi:probable rRNA maturation factor
MIEINNRTKQEIPEKKILEIIRIFLKKYKKEKLDVSVAFVNDAEIRRLNKIYRKKDKATDVLSFDGDDYFLGEILIDLAQIKRQAKELGNSFEEELIFILVHGLLHLLGYNDETDEAREKMVEMGELFIKTLNPNI